MNARNIVGWFAVTLVTLTAGFWAFWGVIEAFHEGWCTPTLGMRLGQLAAYLSPATVLAALAVIGVRWPRVGAALFLLVGLTIAGLIEYDQSKFSGDVYFLLVVSPVLVGLLFLYGRPAPKRVAYALAAGIPLLLILVCGAEPAFRVATRFDDGDRGPRLVEGNGVTLLWAPAGPGWNREGNVTWEKAVERVRYLSEDGYSVAAEPQDVWRLPTREEVVRSLTRHNENAGGTWDCETEQASYARRPDKESPLWDPHAPLIYLWTSEEASAHDAWIVVYHGGIHAKPKKLGAASNGFRAVRDVPPAE